MESAVLYFRTAPGRKGFRNSQYPDLTLCFYTNRTVTALWCGPAVCFQDALLIDGFDTTCAGSSPAGKITNAFAEIAQAKWSKLFGSVYRANSRYFFS